MLGYRSTKSLADEVRLDPATVVNVLSGRGYKSSRSRIVEALDARFEQRRTKSASNPIPLNPQLQDAVSAMLAELKNVVKETPNDEARHG
jgi:hypothetical protein